MNRDGTVLIRKRALRICAVLMLSASSLFAGGPVYSRFGIGDRTFFGSSRMFAMANTGISLYGDGFINRINPAGLAGISETRISGGFEYLNFSSTDNLGKGSFARGEFEGLAFAFPVSKDHGVTLLLESTPYSTVHYALERTDSQLGATSQQRFYGNGGLTALGLGGSYALSQHAIVGAKLNYLFGGIRQINKIDFDDLSYTDSELQRARYHSGYNVTLGTNYHGFADIFDAPVLKALSIGAVFSTPAKLYVREEIFHLIDAASDTIRIRPGSVTIPVAWGIGLSSVLSERFIVAGDLFVQHWKPANFPDDPAVEIRNSSRLSLGFEALPLRNTDSYWGRVAYRAGIAYHSSYIKIGPDPINEFLVSGGLGLPIGPNSRLNLGLQFGVRGTTNNNLQRDTILRLSLSLSASEAWFIRFEED